MPHVFQRAMVLAAALALVPALALAKAPPIGTATFTGLAVGPLAFSSYSFGVTNITTDTGGGGGAGRAVFSPFTLVRPVDSASPTLVLATASGQHIAAVAITVTNGDTPVTYTLHDVLVSSVQHSGGESGPSESLSLTYATIDITVGP